MLWIVKGFKGFGFVCVYNVIYLWIFGKIGIFCCIFWIIGDVNVIDWIEIFIFYGIEINIIFESFVVNGYVYRMFVIKC